jgi:oligoendopeptidase F
VEHLLEHTEDPAERLSLLNQYRENFKGTVYRQTMFAEFEKQIHELAGQGGALTPQALCEIYGKLVEDYFGPDMVVDDEIRYEWARIPHFYRPFYVYKYATSYSAAVALSEGIREEARGVAQGNVKRYLEFLSMGGSKDPLDELRHAGVDLSVAAPIDAALDKFACVLDEAEKIAEKL